MREDGLFGGGSKARSIPQTRTTLHGPAGVGPFGSVAQRQSAGQSPGGRRFNSYPIHARIRTPVKRGSWCTTSETSKA